MRKLQPVTDALPRHLRPNRTEEGEEAKKWHSRGKEGVLIGSHCNQDTAAHFGSNSEAAQTKMDTLATVRSTLAHSAAVLQKRRKKIEKLQHAFVQVVCAVSLAAPPHDIRAVPRAPAQEEHSPSKPTSASASLVRPGSSLACHV